MKKIDKINILHDTIGTYNFCRCLYKYDPNYWYLFSLDVSDKFLFGVKEEDFILNGFQILKISDLKKVSIENGISAKICEKNKLLEGINKPQINLTSWKTVFESLKPLNTMIIVENEKTDKDEDFFYLGYVTSINKSFIRFSAVYSDGEWENNIKIPYSKITSVTFNDRYSQSWQKYLSDNKS